MKRWIPTGTGSLWVLILLLFAGCRPAPTFTSIARQPTSTSTVAPSPTLTSTATFSPTPTMTSTPSPTVTFTPSPMPAKTTTPTPAATLVPPSSPLVDFPLNVGNTWVYTRIIYEGYDTQIVTMTGTITNTVVEMQWQPPVLAAKIESKYEPKQLADDLQQNELAEWAPREAWNSFYWYIISGTLVYSYRRLEPLDLRRVDVKTLLHDSVSEYVFPLDEGACWDPYTGELFKTGNCDERAALREVVDRYETSRSTSDLGPRIVTIPYFWVGAKEQVIELDTRIELDNCATDCSECFLLVTWYNNGANREWLCPGVGVVGGYWHHAGEPFGEVYYLVDYTLNDQPESDTTPASTPVPPAKAGRGKPRYY